MNETANSLLSDFLCYYLLPMFIGAESFDRNSEILNMRGKRNDKSYRRLFLPPAFFCALSWNQPPCGCCLCSQVFDDTAREQKSIGNASIYIVRATVFINEQ